MVEYITLHNQTGYFIFPYKSHSSIQFSVFSLYWTKPFSIKSGISTAIQGANWNIHGKVNNPISLENSNGLYLYSRQVPLHVQYRISDSSSAKVAWNAPSSRFFHLDTFSRFFHPARVTQSLVRLLGMSLESASKFYCKLSSWKSQTNSQNWYSRQTQCRTHISADCECASTFPSTLCPPCWTRVGTSHCRMLCSSPHTADWMLWLELEYKSES